MSKSLGNYVGISEKPEEVFGKLMSISDDLMWRYFELLSFRPLAEIEQFKRNVGEGANPRDIKYLLAGEIVERFQGADAAKHAKEDFIKRVREGGIPDDVAEFEFSVAATGIAIANLLKDAGLVNSTSEALRMIKQGGVKRNGEKIVDPKLQLVKGEIGIFQVGKRKFAKIKLV